nr:PREDICTED: pancreatic triacylglycerol lipase-like isoform X2 [Bemisia tabaci]
MGAMLKDRVSRTQQRIRARKEICYEMVGCFEGPRLRASPLKRQPQPPEVVDTKFFLFTRNNSRTGLQPDLLAYDDEGQSLLNAKFKPKKPIKVIIHGFKGSGKDRGALDITHALLNLEDVNVVVVNWEKGAAGPSYAVAAGNTQLIGRQLGLLLQNMIMLGASAENIHIIGFSLGAHIAGFTGRALLTLKGEKVGRITGLDPASPLFRQVFARSLESLNTDDAHFVDVIHTDGAATWSEGFGLLKPIGHVDYFPNGGQNQPGCVQVRQPLLVSTLEGTTNSSVVCNHVRAWQLFKESLNPAGCTFRAWHCPYGHESFLEGSCFPQKCITDNETGDCGMMGFPAEKSKARGALYLVTKDSSPFCGNQLQAKIYLSEKSETARGYLQLTVLEPKVYSSFQFPTKFQEIRGGIMYSSLSLANHTEDSSEIPEVEAEVSYYTLTQLPNGAPFHPLTIVDFVSVADLNGRIWRYCRKNAQLQQIRGTNVQNAIIHLKSKGC